MTVMLVQKVQHFLERKGQGILSSTHLEPESPAIHCKENQSYFPFPINFPFPTNFPFRSLHCKENQSYLRPRQIYKLHFFAPRLLIFQQRLLTTQAIVAALSVLLSYPSLG